MAIASELKRKLVAFLAGDVVGYKRLMAANEALTVQNWSAYRSFIEDVVADHRGRLIRTNGDSVILEFSSVLDALRSAIEIQQFLREVNHGVPEDQQMLMRFGLHLGDMLLDRENDLGDGVRIAAGLEAQAKPGGICVSDMVYGNVAASPEFSFEALGEVELKKLDRNMQAYRVVTNGAKPPMTTAAAAVANDDNNKPRGATTLGARSAVAVLPFDNLGGDPSHDYFVDGLTEDIITALANWRSFPVIARNSTFAYKGKSPDVRAVAGDLDAGYVLEGSVRMAGGRVRVNAQFIDAENGHHLWAEKFDREIDDIFVLQDEITHHIAATVAPEIEKVERDMVTAMRPKDMTAWAYCLRGRAALELFTPEGNEDARALFERAIELEPGYSAGHIGIAYSHHRDLWFECAPDRQSAIRTQLREAREAVALDPANSDAHMLLGAGYTWERQYHMAIDAGEQAIRLNPSSSVAFLQLGIAQSFVGRPLDGISNFEHALRLSPQDPRIHFTLAMIARAHLNAGDPEQAARWAEKAVHRRVDYPLSHLILASALGHLGRIEEARRALEECERLERGFALRWALRPMYKDPAADQHFLDGLRLAGLDETRAAV